MSEKIFSIALDGPSGAGKSTVAKQLAGAMNAMYLDTGAMYRAVGLYMMNNGICLDDAQAIAQNVENACVDVRFEEGKQKMYLNGQDVTLAIRTPEGSVAASKVSAVPRVRSAMVQRQREIAAGNSVVMDGRDIGTHVLPNAPLKIFLTATPEERARRRWKELNGAQTYEQVLADIIERDLRDTTRAASPLVQAPDAVVIDCTAMNAEEVVQAIMALAKERMQERTRQQ